MDQDEEAAAEKEEGEAEEEGQCCSVRGVLGL